MQPESDNVYISVTEPVEPLGSTLYLFGQLRSSGSVGDRYIKTLININKLNLKVIECVERD